MIIYVCGLLFSEDGEDLLLIRKNRPEWQAGKLNGVGGKVEATDDQYILMNSVLYAMHREFKEEAGIEGITWKNLAVLRDKLSRYRVYFYYAFNNKIYDFKTMTDENLALFPVEEFLCEKSDQLIPDLKFLIPLALDKSGIQKPVILIDESC